MVLSPNIRRTVQFSFFGGAVFFLFVALGCSAGDEGGSDTGVSEEDCALVTQESCYLRAMERIEGCGAKLSGTFNTDRTECSSADGGFVAESFSFSQGGAITRVRVIDASGELCFVWEFQENTESITTAEGTLSATGSGTTWEVTCEDGTQESIPAEAVFECDGAAWPSRSSTASGEAVTLTWSNSNVELYCR